jgi:hypothetical protein
MRIHTNTLIRKDFRDAAHEAGVSIVELSEHSSQSRARAYKFYLSGSAGRPGNRRDEQAATWDEWGIFLAHLFNIDPNAHTGKNGYLSAEHYHWVTSDRFRTLTPSQQHKRHKWQYMPLLPGDFNDANTRSFYAVAQCNCGATQRWILHGHTWEEMAGISIVAVTSITRPRTMAPNILPVRAPRTSAPRVR